MLRTLSLLLPLLAAPPAAPAQAPRARIEALMREANRDPGALVPLLLEASPAVASLASDEAVLLADTLDRYASRAFFSPARPPRMEELGLRVHRVARGEVAERIAQRYRIGVGMLGYLNEGFEPDRLRVGQELKVLDLSDRSLRLEVVRGRYRLLARRGDVLVACFPVGLGAAGSPTPLGATKVANRVLDPQWTHPETKQVFAPRDPGNVLGGYWIALDPAGIGRDGIGLHGYTGEVAEGWIEQPASHGCVRLLQPHVDRVFHLAVEGTPVEIVR
jgi:lipoprotein-anchoring transpeptidase ErfK/SrfK